MYIPGGANDAITDLGNPLINEVKIEITPSSKYSIKAKAYLRAMHAKARAQKKAYGWVDALDTITKAVTCYICDGNDDGTASGWSGYNTVTDDWTDDWSIASAHSKNNSVIRAMRYVQQNYVQWVNSAASTNMITGSGATSGNINLQASVSGTTSTVFTLQWPVLQDYIQEYYDTPPWVSAAGGPVRWTEAQKREWLKAHPQPQKNHRGEHIRSYNNGDLFNSVSREEIAALQLLRQMVPHEQFKHYLKHGFVNVRGKSGLDYQVRRENTIVVRERGEILATLCLYLKLEGRPAPPSDHVVGKILIIEHDEHEVWTRSNVRWETSNRDRRSLEAIGQAAKGKEPTLKEFLTNNRRAVAVP